MLSDKSCPGHIVCLGFSMTHMMGAWPWLAKGSAKMAKISVVPAQDTTHSKGLNTFLHLLRQTVSNLPWRTNSISGWLGICMILLNRKARQKLTMHNCICLHEKKHLTSFLGPPSGVQDFVVKAPTKSGKSDSVAHSVSESLPGLQTHVEMLVVNCLVLHVPELRNLVGSCKTSLNYLLGFLLWT